MTFVPLQILQNVSSCCTTSNLHLEEWPIYPILVSKIWLGMSTNNIYSLQFKIQYNYKNEDFECRCIETHCEEESLKLVLFQSIFCLFFFIKIRAVASLTVPGGQDFHFPHFSSNCNQCFLFFLKPCSFSSSFWPSGWTTCPLGSDQNYLTKLPSWVV